jgi:hypothetical protein
VDDFVAKTEFIKKGKGVGTIIETVLSSMIDDTLTDIERDKLLNDLQFEAQVNSHLYSNEQLKIQVISAFTDVLSKKAEVNLLNARIEAEKGKASLISKAVNNFDSLPQSLQVYVVRAVFNPNDTQTDDILLQEEIREYLKMEKEAVAKKSQAEADRTKEETEFIKWKHEQTKKDKGTV